MDTASVIKQCEDHMFRALGLSARERVLYYHLLRQTHLEGKASAMFALLPLANATGVSESSTRDDIRALHERGCIRIEERSRSGHLVRVLLPHEIEGVLPKAAPPKDFDLEAQDFFAERKFIEALLAREDSRCFYCMKTLTQQSCELDHVVSQVSGRNNSYRNIVCSCHDCNRAKQAQPAEDFLRGLYRRGVLSQPELANRLAALEQLVSGSLVPDRQLVQNAL